MSQFMFELGVTVIDEATGYTGTITARVNYLQGKNQYCVENKASDPRWLEEGRIGITVDSIVQEDGCSGEATRTQGRKGQKLPRINMAFATENLEYLHLITSLEGGSITKYVNSLIEADRQKRADIVKQVQKLKNKANGDK